MRVSREKAAICGILLSQVFCGQVLANGDINDPCYQNVVDTENSNFGEGESLPSRRAWIEILIP